MDYSRGDGACWILVVLAAGDAAGFGLCDGDDGGEHFVGCFCDGAEGLGFGYCCSLGDDLGGLLACSNLRVYFDKAYCDCLGLGES